MKNKVYKLEALAEKNQRDLKEFERLRDLAYSSIKTASWDRCVDNYEKALKVYPDHAQVAEVFGNLGRCYVEKELYDDAISYITKSIEERPYEAYNYNNLGIAYMGKGLRAEACANYRLVDVESLPLRHILLYLSPNLT